MKPLLHAKTNQVIDALLQRPGGSWILSGSQSMATALWLACALHGHGQPNPDCVRCKQILSGSHPDIYMVNPSDKGSIGIAEIHTLTRNLGVSRHDLDQPYRVIIVNQAETMTVEAQNAFLKNLEEPPKDALIILATSHPAKLLETIRSRCKLLLLIPAEPPVNEAEESIATELLKKTSFERLIFFGGEVPPLTELIENFSHTLSYKLRQATSDLQAQQLTQAQLALERLQRNLQQNVSPKTALTGFFLELPCI